MTPAWILDILATVMLAVAGVSVARLAAAQVGQRSPVVTSIDLAHLLMALAMAGTLAASLTTFPGTAWEVIFGLLTAWFACQVWRDARANGSHALAGGHGAPHLAHSAAMLYMFAALISPAAGGPAMGGTSGSAMRTLQYPALAFVFALVLAGYSVWDLDRLSGRRYSLASAVVPPTGAVVPALAGPGSAPVAANGPRPTAGSAAMNTLPLPAAADQAVAGEAVAVGGAPDKGPVARMLLLSPGVSACCRIALGITMAFMLAIMI